MATCLLLVCMRILLKSTGAPEIIAAASRMEFLKIFVQNLKVPTCILTLNIRKHLLKMKLQGVVSQNEDSNNNGIFRTSCFHPNVKHLLVPFILIPAFKWPPFNLKKQLFIAVSLKTSTRAKT